MIIRRVINKVSRTLWPPPPPITSGIHLCDLRGVKLMLDLSAPNYQAMNRNKEFEPEVTRVLHSMLGPGEVFVDIGANVGWHTFSLLVRRPDVRISYAYEAARQTFELLEAGIVANDCADRCEARRIALSDRKGSARFKVFTGQDPMHFSLYPLADVPYVEEEVELDTLDSQAETFIGPPAVVKCDVEGGELDILKGARGVLGGKFGPPPIWFLEANYETSGMAGYFPWQMLEFAAECAPYEGYFIRQGRVIPLPGRTALKHGDTLILAVPELHGGRLAAATTVDGV